VRGVKPGRDLAMKLGKTTPLKTGGVILHYLPQAAG